MRNRALLWAEITLLTLGFVCLGWVGYEYAQSRLSQSYDTYALQQQLQGQIPTVGGYLDELVKQQNEEPVAQDAVPKQPKANYKPPKQALIGKIEIPRLKLEAVVREGVDSRTLSRAVGHVPQTALPGMPGNVGVAAHRDTFFRPVKGIRKGDLIRMVTPEGTYEYEVENTKIVMPSNVEVLAPTPEPSITLVTCYPFNYVGSAPKRFIIRARQIERQARTTPVDKAGG